MDIWVIFGYVALQLVIAVWVARGTSSHIDYLVAGRKLGVFAVAMSVFATWFASETVLAVSAEVASDGLSAARFEPMGFGLGIVLVGLFVALPLRAGNHVTLAGFIGARYGSQSELLSAFVIAASGTVWAAAQLYALAVILASTTSFGFDTALIGAAAVVIGYTLIGGLAGDIITDIIQGVVLAVGLILFLIIAFDRAGGVEAALASIPVEKLSLRPSGEGFVDSLEVWLIPIFAAIASQEVIARLLAARTPQIARQGALAGSAIYLCIGVIPIALGLFGPELGIALGDGDAFLPSLAAATLPSWLYIVFSGALLSAILSSVDSALLAVSAVVIDSGYKRINPEMTQRQSLSAARGATVCAGLLALAIASAGDSLREIAIDTAAIGGVLAVPLILALLVTKVMPGWANLPLNRAACLAIIAQIICLTALNQVLVGSGAFFWSVMAGCLVFSATCLMRARVGARQIT